MQKERLLRVFTALSLLAITSFPLAGCQEVKSVDQQSFSPLLVQEFGDIQIHQKGIMRTSTGTEVVWTNASRFSFNEQTGGQLLDYLEKQAMQQTDKIDKTSSMEYKVRPSPENTHYLLLGSGSHRPDWSINNDGATKYIDRRSDLFSPQKTVSYVNFDSENALWYFLVEISQCLGDVLNNNPRLSFDQAMACQEYWAHNLSAPLYCKQMGWSYQEYNRWVHEKKYWQFTVPRNPDSQTTVIYTLPIPAISEQEYQAIPIFDSIFG